MLIYLLFLLILGLPIMIMEFSVGRASQKSAARSFHLLEPKGSKWHIFSYFAMLGNYMLMAFYTTVGGWMVAYFYKMLKGEFVGKTPQEVGVIFGQMLVNPKYMAIWMVLTVIICFAVCYRGLQNGVEKVNKVMMLALLGIMVILAIRSVTLDGAAEGLEFYLKPRLFQIVYCFGRNNGSGVCGIEPVILYFVLRYRRFGNLRLLYRQGTQFKR